MTSTVNSSLFGVYNARHLDPRDVAATFVPQQRFWDLLRTSNNLLVGPRGSGKTTLLKMLQPAAMSAWDHPRADEARSLLKFVGVFVPTDLNWAEEINVAVTALPHEERDTLTEALFVANVQLALVTSLFQLSEPEASRASLDWIGAISKIHESEIVSQLERRWNFNDDDVDVPSFRSFRASIRARIRILSSYRPNLPDKKKSIDLIRETLGKSQFNFESTFLEAIDVVEMITSISRKWGLLFDEMELANDFLQRAVFSRLRAANAHQVVYKLAVVPHVPAADILNRVNAPGITNDWTPIPLWYTDQLEATKFCRELWEQIVSSSNARNIDPRLLFGESGLGDATSRSRSLPGLRTLRYADRGHRQKEFKSLYAKDPSFRAFLAKYSIDPEKLDQVPQRLMDSVVRKIAPFVKFRDEVLAEVRVDGKARRRSRKSYIGLYSGWEAICVISEGNPRWFKSIVDVLLSEWLAKSGVISRNRQAEELERASRRFRALVAACPIGDSVASDASFGPLQFVERIADFQHEWLINRPFSLDIPLAIECDQDADPALIQLLSACLNVGAIISTDDDAIGLSLAELRGRKFRLSYLLAPSLVLPLRTGNSRALSTIFSRSRLSKISKLRAEDARGPNQISLWEA